MSLNAQESVKNRWINSVGVGFGLNTFVEEQSPTYQFDYLIYKQRSSGNGIGGGLTLTIHEGLPGYHNDIGTHTFGNIFFYSKAYFNEYRKGFVDVKLGYGVGLDSEEYHCGSCNDPNATLSYRYLSTKMIQIGIGSEYKLTDKMKWGIKLSPQLLFADLQVGNIKGKREVFAVIFNTSLYF